MPEILKREAKLEWACRVLMTANVFIIISGYLAFFQTKNQLVSPLIPRSTVYDIASDTGNILFKISLLAALLFTVGIWLYSFKKKIAAILVFSAVVFLFLAKHLFVKIQVLHMLP